MQLVYKLIKKWNSYKYRFVPWMKLKLYSQATTRVTSSEKDKLVLDNAVLQQILSTFIALKQCACESSISGAAAIPSEFQLEVRGSLIAGSGKGVFVSKGRVKKGTVVALYPGTVYLPHDPIFFQSIGNPYIFKCSDNIYVDGKSKGLSRLIYSSCAGRDRIGPFKTCDTSWLSGLGKECSFNVGQLVNNQTLANPANVRYQEFDFPADFPLELRKFIPNVFYQGLKTCQEMRTVALVSTREIVKGEELLSTYYTVIEC